MEKSVLIRLNENKKMSDNRNTLLSICFVSILLVLSYCVNQYFMVVLFVFSSLYILMSQASNSTSFFIGLLPASEIFLFNQFNVFYLLVLVFIFKIIISYPFRLPQVMTMSLFSIYYIVTLDFTTSFVTSILLTLLNILAVIMVISNYDKIDAVSTLKAFLFGMLLATIIGLFASRIGNLSEILSQNYIDEKFRFAGLSWDTNFYAALVSFSVASCMVLFNVDKKKRVLYVFCGIIFIIAGVFTMSKSYLLSMGLLFVCWLLFSNTRPSIKCAVFCACILGGVIFYLSAPIDSSFKLMIGRALKFFTGEASLNDFTTGRTDLWFMYIKEMIERPFVLLFGAGIATFPISVQKAVHNTYLEVIWAFGIFGTIIFIASLYFASKSYKKRIVSESGEILVEKKKQLTRKEKKEKCFNFIGCVSVAFSFMALSGFTNISFMWLIFLAIALFKLPTSMQNNQRRKL